MTIYHTTACKKKKNKFFGSGKCFIQNIKGGTTVFHRTLLVLFYFMMTRWFSCNNLMCVILLFTFLFLYSLPLLNLPLRLFLALGVEF